MNYLYEEEKKHCKKLETELKEAENKENDELQQSISNFNHIYHTNIGDKVFF